VVHLRLVGGLVDKGQINCLDTRIVKSEPVPEVS
jgi:hypothetical protein